MTLRYGIIGSGTMGQEHVRNVALLDGAEIAAVADPDEGMRRQAADLAGNVAAYSDYRDLLSAGTCDALIVAAPNDTHHRLLLDLIATNKPILCEKPLCTSAADCRDIVTWSEAREAPIWVAMEYRYMPPVQRLLAELGSGTAGPSKMMAIREHRYPFLDKVGDWNRFNSRTGGTLVEKCCHFWDLMRLTLQSDPVRVFASAAADVNHQDERYDGEVPDIIDNAYVVVDFESGARGMLDLCMFAEAAYWQETITVTGPKARIEARIPGPSRFTKDGKERHAELAIASRKCMVETVEQVTVDETILRAGDHHGSTYFQHEKFRDLVLGGSGKPEVGLVDGLWSVRVGEAAERSAREGRVVSMDEV